MIVGLDSPMTWFFPILKDGVLLMGAQHAFQPTGQPPISCLVERWRLPAMCHGGLRGEPPCRPREGVRMSGPRVIARSQQRTEPEMHLICAAPHLLA